jgi:alginate O-acetyltransferase complex protein AlgI
MAFIADTIFNSNMVTSYSCIVILVALLSYTFQIYFDFSGYSDMAIGLGRIFGFTFMENFNYPYISTSITDSISSLILISISLLILGVLI